MSNDDRTSSRPAHLAPTRSRGRRLLRGALLAALGAVVVVVIWIAALMVTNPGPSPSPGWERLADMPSGRGEVAAAVVDDALVVAGGLGGPGRTRADVHRYEDATDSWTRLPDLPAGRHHAAAASVDGTVYVVGGASSARDWTPRSNLWALPPGARAWEERAPLPEGRQGHDVVAFDGELIVVGGEGGDATLRYDHEEDEWAVGAPIPLARDHLRAEVLGEEVWVLGGRNGGTVDRVDIYDPSADRWREGPALPEVMSAMVVGVVDGRLHVVGGELPAAFRGRVIDAHVSIETGDETWRAESPAMLAVHGAGGGAVGDRLVVAGGSRRQGVLSVLAWTGFTQAHDPAGE